jgi:serine/threonine protein kinase
MQKPGQSQIPEGDDDGRAGSPVNDSDSSALETVAAPASHTSIPRPQSYALDVLARRYDILSEAGRGAMGQVYKARDRETGETVALKILKPEIASDPAMIERFKSELLFARRITHKNVCRVHEFNRVDGVAYTSMEFVEGESLRSVLKRFGSVTQRKGTDMAAQICSGLKEAHAQGIVHRDLKPENVMIDTNGNVKIMDFGIARSMETLTLTTGALIGTPAYMAPEQAAGKPVDHRADIYALGLMLYEMFTGTQAFRGDNAISVALKQMNEPPKPPREIEPSISPAMEQAILRCLEKDPDKRFQSIAELESELRPGRAMPNAATGATGATAATAGAAPAPAIAQTSATSVTTPIPASTSEQQKKNRPRAAAILLIIFLAFAARVVWRHLFPGSPGGRESGNLNVTAPGLSVAITPNSVAINEDQPAKAPEAPERKSPKAPETVAAHQPAAAAAESVHSKTRSEQPTAPPEPVKNLAGSDAEATTSAANSALPATAPKPAPVPSGATAKADAASESSSAANNGGYVWVNRFPRQLGAQNAANKIEAMGLPVSIIPRHNAANDSEFFIVLSGPFPAGKIDSAIGQLKSNGFPFARPNRTAAPAKRSLQGASPAKQD